MYLCQAASFQKTAQLDAAAHAELLCSGLAAAKSLLDYYLSLPVYADIALNNSEWIQISFAITVASRLAVATTANTTTAAAANPATGGTIAAAVASSVLGGAGALAPVPVVMDPQTRAALRQSLDLANVLRHLSLRIGALVTQQVDSHGGRDIFYHYEQRVRRMQAWYERCCGGSGGGTAPATGRKPASPPTTNVTKMEQQPSVTSAPQHHQQQQLPTASGAMVAAPPFTHDALGLLSQPPSGATTPVLYSCGMTTGAEQQQQFFQNLADPTCIVWSANSSQANTPDMKMTELFPELDYNFCDWLSPPIEG